MIKEIIGAEAVGLYARLSELWYFIPAAIFPAIVNAKKHSEDLYYSRLQKLYDLMVAIPLSFFGDIIVKLLFGNEYYGAGSVLVIHVFLGRYLLTENLNKKTFYRTSFGAVLNSSIWYTRCCGCYKCLQTIFMIFLIKIYIAKQK